jgi:diguanylate cyclase (GGDEF)-like protein
MSHSSYKFIARGPQVRRRDAELHGEAREVVTTVTGARPRGAVRSSLPGAIEWLSRLPASLLMGLAVCLVAAIGVGDYVTGPDISFAVAYLGPVFLAATAGRRTSTAIAAVAAMTWTAVEIVFRTRPYASGVVPVWNLISRFLVLWFVAILVSALAAKLAEERFLSRTDVLTGLRNARALHEAIDTEIARMRRTGGTLTAAYIDIDDFKMINDAHGHAGGDEVLIQVGRIMAAGLRGTDVVARIGGDEFAVLLPGTGLPEALDRLRALQEQLRAATSARTPAVGFSVGAVTFTEPPDSARHVLRSADRVMYQVKRHGKNAIWGEPASPAAEWNAGTVAV